MTQQNNHEDIYNFYSRLIKNTVNGIQKKICDKAGVTLSPNCADDLCPMPVFEDASSSSLLSHANECRRPTTISWLPDGSYQFLNAYIKTYRNAESGRKHSEIVVTSPNYCWARFFAAKELMHCFIDDDGYPATNTVDLANALIDDLVAEGFPRTEGQTIVDNMAWLGAALYLIPDSWVEPINQTLAALTKVDAKNAHSYMAQKIRAPELVLRTRLRYATR